MSVKKEVPKSTLLASASSAEATAKRAINDSVFTHLFRIPEYRLQLYQALHPEDSKITADQLRLVTLENILLNQPYNDLGILAEDRLLILVEAQNTWSENILIRVLIYLAQTFQNYITETQQDIYGSKNVNIPTPEFYVIYTGPGEKRPETLYLSQAFFDGKETDAEICVHMIYDGAQGDIIQQYVSFTKICKEQFEIHGRNKKAIEEAIQICKNNDVLADYLSSREKEVVSIMDILFNQEYAVTMYAKGLEEKAHAKGLSEGISQGLSKGLRKGKEDGKLLHEFQQILAKQRKNKSLETTAEEMEVEPEKIRRMYLLAQSHPQQSADDLLKLWKHQRRKRG